MRKSSLTVALLLLANAAGAQTARPIPDIALDALKIGKGGIIADGEAILVPTAIMHFSIGGSMWVQSKSGGANAHDPQAAEVLLALAAMREGVLPRVVDLLDRIAELAAA